MNEFIVWDIKSESFRQIIKIDFVNMYFQLESKSSDDYKVNLNDLTTHTYIHKTDIEGNKIYAESSIIEFDFLGFGEDKAVQYQGFVKWNLERYRYDIEVFSHADKDGDNYIFDLGKCIDRIKNIKIVGTLQQNIKMIGNF